MRLTSFSIPISLFPCLRANERIALRKNALSRPKSEGYKKSSLATWVEGVAARYGWLGYRNRGHLPDGEAVGMALLRGCMMYEYGAIVGNTMHKIEGRIASVDTPLTPNLNDIFAYIDEHSQLFLARLLEYLRHPSISAYGEGI